MILEAMLAIAVQLGVTTIWTKHRYIPPPTEEEVKAMEDEKNELVRKTLEELEKKKRDEYEKEYQKYLEEWNSGGR